MHDDGDGFAGMRGAASVVGSVSEGGRKKRRSSVAEEAAEVLRIADHEHSIAIADDSTVMTKKGGIALEQAASKAFKQLSELESMLHSAVAESMPDLRLE